MPMNYNGTPGRARLVMSLRTEYHGRVLGQLRQDSPDLRWLRDYLLHPLDSDALLEAMLRPIATEAPPGCAEVPFQKYGFAYEEGLPEEIVGRLPTV